MLFIRKYIVRKHERGLLFKDGDFIKFLGPGLYRFYSLRHHYWVECFDQTDALFEHPLGEAAERATADSLMHQVQTRADRIAPVCVNERAKVAGGLSSQMNRLVKVQS